MVEHLHGKQKVAGSIPADGSRIPKAEHSLGLSLLKYAFGNCKLRVEIITVVLLGFALATAHSEPYIAQLITFFISVLPVVLLLALIIGTLIWQVWRKRRRDTPAEAELTRELLRK